jgi:hypothetical protein
LVGNYLATSFILNQVTNWAIPSKKRTRNRWKGKCKKAQNCCRIEPKW